MAYRKRNHLVQINETRVHVVNEATGYVVAVAQLFPKGWHALSKITSKGCSRKFHPTAKDALRRFL